MLLIKKIASYFPIISLYIRIYLYYPYFQYIVGQDRIPVLVRFTALVQTGPGAHSASYTMGTGTFSGIKRPGCGVDHPPTSRAKVKKRVELYFYSNSGPTWLVLG
jgi:hypothetical protein